MVVLLPRFKSFYCARAGLCPIALQSLIDLIFEVKEEVGTNKQYSHWAGS